MSRTSQITKIIDKRQPLTKNIEETEVNLKTLASRLSHLEDNRQTLLNKVDELNIIGRLKEIDFFKIQQDIASELQALKKLKRRFSRDTLNIGVIGRARQGKSRLLQSLTGLSKAEIPDGSGQHCTGVRSTIHHNPNMTTYGEVVFYTERSFIDEVIAPYYEELKLGIKPINIDNFASKELPSLPNDLNGAEVNAKYEVKSQVVEVLINKVNLGGITEAQGVNFLPAIAKRLTDEDKLKFGFKILSEFELSYRGTIQHRIRQCLNGLTPDKTNLHLSEKSPNAEQIMTNLKMLHQEAVYQCETALEDFLCEPSQAGFAIVEEFLDRVLRAENVQREWRNFLYEERAYAINLYAVVKGINLNGKDNCTYRKTGYQDAQH